MVSWFRKIEAKLVLAGLFILHLFSRVFLFWRKKKGLEHFLSQFAADAIYPVGKLERKQFPDFQKCQTCSLCTFTCKAVREGRAPADFEPKYIMLGFGRSTHDSEYFLEEWLPCNECERCTVECPNDVPIYAMAGQIIARRKQVAFRQE